MRKALLTIDDSPSQDSDELTLFLQANNVPAVFFCRGDRLKDNPEPMVRAVERGFVIANHAFNHRRASQITFEEAKTEILDTERLIENIYQQAGKPQPAKYFRFPHMDRGAGGWVVDYDAVPVHSTALKTLFADGLNVTLDPPSAEQVEKKRLLQEFLRVAGFTRLPSDDITHKWFTDTEMAHAVDAMFTFSTSDWMLTARHLGKWPYKSIEDLKQKIDDDPWLNTPGSANIILAHDQPEVLPTVKALVTHMLHKNFTFTPV
jgi:peptidoglycan/xylan/chitin deacetylase (PgdA/CDA1 family)